MSTLSYYVVFGIGRILNSHFEPLRHVQLKSLRAHHKEMWEEMKEIRSVTSNIHSSAEVTKSRVAHKTYSGNLIQFWILNGSCPFSLHFHIILSYLSLIHGGEMSPLINFYVFICHKMAIMQPHSFLFSPRCQKKTQDGVRGPHFIMHSIQMSEISLSQFLLQVTSVLFYAQSSSYKTCLRPSIISRHF